MKTFLLVLSGTLLSLALQAQHTVVRSSDWKVVYEDSKVSISSRYVDCNLPSEGLFAEYILLKMTNRTKDQIRVSWYGDRYYPEGCVNCDHDSRDRLRMVDLKPNESKEGNCQPGPNIGLKVFVKWLKMPNKRTLEQLILTDIQTSTLN